MPYIRRRGFGDTTMADVQSATNCTKGGGTYNFDTGDCVAPPGGSLYKDQLAAMAANDAQNAVCPWYCLPWISYPSNSACSVPECTLGVNNAVTGGIPIWGWAALGIAALFAFKR